MIIVLDPYHWWDEIYQQRERDIESAKTEL